MSTKVTLKEAVRHAAWRFGLQRHIDWVRRKRGRDIRVHSLPTLRERFDYIYDHSLWTPDDPRTPLSGSGSSLKATTVLRTELPRLLDSVNAASILDVGCGDFTWMSEIDLRQRYMGVDVVESIIKENQRRYPDRSFACIDATVEKLPDADVVVCREVLFHLSFTDARLLLANVVRSSAGYLLMTSDRSTALNADIVSGDFRPLNLQRRPFRFPAPIATINDAHVQPGRFLGLWSIVDIADEMRLV